MHGIATVPVLKESTEGIFLDRLQSGVTEWLLVQIFILIISFPQKRPGQISEMRTHIQHPNFLRGLSSNFWTSLRMHLFVIQIRPRTRGLRPSHVSRKRDYVVQLDADTLVAFFRYLQNLQVFPIWP